MKKLFKKSLSYRWKFFGPFFLKIPTTARIEYFFKLDSVFLPLWCLLWNLFFNTKDFFEKTNFWNKATLPVKKILGHYSCNILTKKIMEQLICVPKVFLNFCGSNRISSIGPQRSLDKTSQKSLSSCWKNFWSFFPQFT